MSPAQIVALLTLEGVVLVGVFVLALVQLRRSASAEISWLRAELREANDRLYAVSREPGAIVPPRTEPLEPAPVLDPELESLAHDWEGEEAQATIRAQFLRWRGEGLSVAECKRRNLEGVTS